MLRRLARAVYLLLVVQFFMPVYAASVTLTAFHYPPYMDESRPGKGLFCELVAAAYKAVGYETVYRFYPLKRSTRYVGSGMELGQLGTEWNFPIEVRENAIVSVPLFYYRVVGFYLKDRFESFQFNSVEALQGYQLSVIRGSSDAAILKRYPELGLQIDEVNHAEQVLQKLYRGWDDIGFMVELTGLDRIKSLYPHETERWAMTDDAIQGIPAHVIFSRNYPDFEEYVSAFKLGLKAILADGTYMQIFEKYYGKGKVPAIVKQVERQSYIIPKTISAVQ